MLRHSLIVLIEAAFFVLGLLTLWASRIAEPCSAEGLVISVASGALVGTFGAQLWDDLVRNGARN
jgi:hypothetical protein